MLDKALNFIRGLIRPFLTIGIIGLLAAIVLRYAAPQIDVEAAKTLLYFFSGAGSLVLGYWFGERKKS